MTGMSEAYRRAQGLTSRESRKFFAVSIAFLQEIPLAPWMYGIAADRRDGSLWFVADFRAEKGGIYKLSGGNLELAVPDIRGAGLCFFPNGAALVCRYGHSHPDAFKGIPGALVYVPAEFFA